MFPVGNHYAAGAGKVNSMIMYRSQDDGKSIHKKSPRIIAIANQKGGVGKSSITCNLAAISAEMGYSTLVIDLDVQGNSSMYLGYDIHSEEALTTGTSVANIFKQRRGLLSTKQPPDDYVLATEHENLFLLPASIELEAMEKDLESRYKVYQLRKALEQIDQHYDRIYIETAPNFNFYSKSALIATNTVLIPFDCDSFSKQALYNLIDNMMELKEDKYETIKKLASYPSPYHTIWGSKRRDLAGNTIL